MKLPFVSYREGKDGENQNQNRSRTIQISVPCELVMDLLSQGAILQLQMGPVPLRPNLTRPEGPGANNSRPDPRETVNIRPNPSGGSDIDPPRPERPPSRHPAVRTVRTVRPIRPVSPFTDWSSLSENDVISVSSDDEDNYVPRSQDQKQKQRTKTLDIMLIIVNLVPQGELFRSLPMTMRIDPYLLWVEVTSYKEFLHF